MNARRILVPLVLLLLVLVGLFQHERNASDPTISGKKLSIWISEFDIWKGPSAPAAEMLGISGASPEKLLTGMLRRRDSKWKLKLRELLSKQTLIKFSFTPAASAQEQALNTCNLLGPQVSGTVPAIAALVMDYPQGSVSGKIAVHALNTLAVMGTNGVPAIVQALAHRDPTLRLRAAQLLGSMRGAGSEETIQALQALARDRDVEIAGIAVASLDRLKSRRVFPGSGGEALRAGELPETTPVSVWDMARGNRIVSTSPLYPGCRPEDLFGARLSSVGTSETGSAIFDDSVPDGFVNFIEWETPSPVTVRSFGLIGAHETALYAFIRAFRGFRLYARPEGDEHYSQIYAEDVPVPYGTGYCAALLACFKNLPTPVTARHFRVEFIQNGSGSYHGARAVELYGFGVPLSTPLITAAMENQESAIRDGVHQALGITR